MKDQLVERDERTAAIENAGYRWAYLFLSFGLLLIVAVRGYLHAEASWDLMALVILGGGVHFAFRTFHGALYKSLALRVGIALIAGVLLAVVLVLVRK